VTVSVLLILLSTHMLAIDGLARGISVGLIGGIAITVAALSCGLGAVFLDLRQRNPSAIVSGFGGTLNLVLSLSFMLAAILPFGLLFHLHSRLELGDAMFHRGVVIACAWVAAITMAATSLPLWLGVRSLLRRDF
jgi:ABC-2 type transport system permease protein